MNNSFNDDLNHNADDRLRRQVAAAIGPVDITSMPDEQLEALLGAVNAEAYDDEEVERLLGRVWSEIATPLVEQPDSTTDRSTSDTSCTTPAPLPITSELNKETHAYAPSSPVLGFLGGVTQFGSFTPTVWALLILVPCMTMSLGLAAFLAIRGAQGRVDGTVAVSVARLTRTADCVWSDPDKSPSLGDDLSSGRELRIASGVIELDFGVGVQAVVQGPARLDLLTESKVFLYSGKMFSKILKPEARGFEVRTSKGAVIDLGTEFGVEVTSSQDVEVQVTKGEVVVERPTTRNAVATAQHLLRNEGLRLDGNFDDSMLVEDVGERFVRSIETAGRDRHVVAYWRFEDRPIGALLPETNKNSREIRATVDSSFNGNDLYSFYRGSQPTFSADVAAEIIAESHAENRSCLDNTLPPEFGHCRNVYTHSQFSHAAPRDVQKIAPAQWTIEASVKAAQMTGTDQAFIVRDGTYTQNKLRNPARLIMHITAAGRFAVQFFDGANRLHEAIAQDLPVEASRWYHLAAVSDGRKLQLYVDAIDGCGYVLRASTDLPATGSTALGKGSDDAEWSIGRGSNQEAESQVAQQFYGWIDEVRISDIAREPHELLFAPPVQDAVSGEPAELAPWRKERRDSAAPALKK